jgi:hypothetical protein
VTLFKHLLALSVFNLIFSEASLLFKEHITRLAEWLKWYTTCLKSARPGVQPLVTQKARGTSQSSLSIDTNIQFKNFAAGLEWLMW